MAQSLDSNEGVYFVPALVGMGAPYWDPTARGMLIGLTRGTTPNHIARAALEALAYQTRDVIEEIKQLIPERKLSILRVDGGASLNNLLMQFQSDLLRVPVIRPIVEETTALGAAYLAGLAVGYWEGLDDIRHNWARDAQFLPSMESVTREHLRRRWREAVERSRNWAEA